MTGQYVANVVKVLPTSTSSATPTLLYDPAIASAGNSSQIYLSFEQSMTQSRTGVLESVKHVCRLRARLSVDSMAFWMV